MDIENRKIFAYMLNENLIYKHIPTMLAHSVEFRASRVKSLDEQNSLNKIKSDDIVRQHIPKENSRKG